MEPGITVNQRYQIVSEIGRGGMGIVYRGRNLALGKDVAIKIFNDAVDAEGLARAQREAHALANVQHENLVRVFALESNEQGQLMLVFDFIEGEPLDKLMARRATPLLLEEAAEIFRQLCTGLQTLHDSGFIHRDVKPANIMVQQREGKPHVVLIDFGLAKSTTNASQKLTSTGMLIGTPLYMSPEQFASQKVTAQSDLYSAACVLYEMLSGKPPFEDESPYMVASLHMTAEVPPLEDARFNSFFSKALAKVPQDRFGSASQMFVAFEHAMVASAVKQRSPNRNRRTKINGTQIMIVLGTVAGMILAVYALSTSHDVSTQTNHTKAMIEDAASEAINEVHSPGKYWAAEPRDYHGARAFLARKIAELEPMGEGGLKMSQLYASYAGMCMDNDRPNRPFAYDAARDALLKALPLAQKSGAPAPQIADIYHLLSEYSRNVCMFPDSLKYAKLGCNIRGIDARDLNNNDKKDYAYTLEKLGRFDELLALCEERVNEVNDLCDTTQSMRRSVAHAYWAAGRFDDAVKLMAVNAPRKEDMLERDLQYRAYAASLAGKTELSEKAIAEARTLERHNVTPAKPWMSACHALNLATQHKPKAARQALDDLLNASSEKTSEESTHYYRTRLFDTLDALQLCEKAAERIGDTHSAAQCRQHADQIKQYLIKQGCLSPIP